MRYLGQLKETQSNKLMIKGKEDAPIEAVSEKIPITRNSSTIACRCIHFKIVTAGVPAGKYSTTLISLYRQNREVDKDKQ